MIFPLDGKDNEAKPKIAVKRYKKITAWRWLKPISKRRKWRCLRSAAAKEFPCQSRRIITHKTSRIGTPIIKRAVAIFEPEIIDKTPSIKPQKTLPPSPRKIFAGCQLKTKNPKQAPAKIKAIIEVPEYGTSQYKLTIKIIIEPIAVIPVARPSKPSRNLVV